MKLTMKVTKGYWQAKNNRRKFFEELNTKLGLNNISNWKNVTTKDIIRNGGSSLIHRYSNNLFRALEDTFPEYKWDRLQFEHKFPAKYWQSIDNQRKYFLHMEEKFEIRNFEDWNKIKNSQVKSNGGSGILKIYNNSLYKALTNIFPERKLNLLSFRSHSKKENYKINAKILINQLISTFLVQKKSDWYRISVEQIAQFVNGASDYCIGGLKNLLVTQFPQENWQFLNQNKGRGKKASQRWLLISIQRLIKFRFILLENYHHPLMKFKSETIAELDIYIPELNVGFEYQGEQHYNDYPTFSNLNSSTTCDQQKESLASKHSIYYLVIPYWWDKSPSSLYSILSSSFSNQFKLNSVL